MKHVVKQLKRPLRMVRRAASRFPVVTFAIILAVGMLGASFVFAHKARTATGTTGFDTSTVLPQPVSMPGPAKTFTADTLKEYDGKDGHACYVAVKGTVYEIKDNQYWKDGEHTPSGGRGYCGADMTSVIGQSPHGESVLSSLPKVGTLQ